MAQLGKLYLIPTTLGETENPFDVLPQTIKRSIELLDYYIVENEKTARKFIKSICPEKVQATLHLSALNKHTQDSEYKKMVEEYQGKLKKYDAEASTVTDAVNQTRQQEVQDMAKRISDYQETAQKDLQKKESDLMKPITDKVKASIQKVGKAKGYQYVLDSATGNGVILADGFDLLMDVKKELGI